MKKLLVRINAQSHMQLRMICLAQDRTVQELVGELVEQYVKRHAAEAVKAIEGGEK